MKTACCKLHEMGAAAVGHHRRAPGEGIDLLSFKTRRGVEQEIFKAERQRSKSTHGTGCAFATAMACHLALDRAWRKPACWRRPMSPQQSPTGSP